ncbi:hypothetical protein [uncultured Litoreibacter sp.]|uniref:hypothetical protein n=1 Tax=uncultured Litoreibacter sp. TaxID=1392394 RepID=UPI00263A382E|nr:hypothetical protein [uncultured Litoreibacter sp.]
MNEAELILMVVKIWGGIGALVAVAFLTFGMDRLDEDAQGAYVFRPLIVPGVLLIWPLVLWRWYILADGKDEWSKRYRPRRRAHHMVALIMPIAIVLVIAAGLAARQTWPTDVAPVQLSEPAQ